MRKVAGEHPFCVLIYMNSYIFHVYFILFNLLSYPIFDFVCLTLSLANTHGIVKYARTNIRDIHTHAHTQKKSRKTRKNRGGVRKERKKKKRKDKKKRGKRRRKLRGKGGEGKKEKEKKERGRGMGLGG